MVRRDRPKAGGKAALPPRAYVRTGVYADTRLHCPLVTEAWPHSAARPTSQSLLQSSLLPFRSFF